MKKPAGISDASEKAIQRWQLDQHTFQVYNYEDHNMLFNPDTKAFRLPTAEEAELLMGIDKYYILGASKHDSDSRTSFIIRRQLIGNSFNCYAVSFLLGQALSKITNEDIPLHSYLQVGVADRPLTDHDINDPDFVDNEELAISLVEQYLRIAEKGGSDVRLELGVPFRPGAWPRAGAKTQYWSWAIAHGYPWRNSAGVHINKLELLAVFNSLKWRTRSTKQQRSRFLHMVDSQVVGAILTKGRTSSRLLRPTIRKITALTLAAQLYPAYIFVASEDNPADIPSRWGVSRRKAVKLRKSQDEEKHTSEEPHGRR